MLIRLALTLLSVSFLACQGERPSPQAEAPKKAAKKAPEPDPKPNLKPDPKPKPKPKPKVAETPAPAPVAAPIPAKPTLPPKVEEEEAHLDDESLPSTYAADKSTATHTLVLNPDGVVHLDREIVGNLYGAAGASLVERGIAAAVARNNVSAVAVEAGRSVSVAAVSRLVSAIPSSVTQVELLGLRRIDGSAARAAFPLRRSGKPANEFGMKPANCKVLSGTDDEVSQPGDGAWLKVAAKGLVGWKGSADGRQTQTEKFKPGQTGKVLAWLSKQDNLVRVAVDDSSSYQDMLQYAGIAQYECSDKNPGPEKKEQPEPEEPKTVDAATKPAGGKMVEKIAPENVGLNKLLSPRDSRRLHGMLGISPPARPCRTTKPRPIKVVLAVCPSGEPLTRTKVAHAFVTPSAHKPQVMANRLAVAMGGPGVSNRIAVAMGGPGVSNRIAVAMGGPGQPLETAPNLGGKRAGRRLGKLKIGATSAKGFCNKSDVRTRIRRRAGALRACYERRLKAKPELAGKLIARWTIGVDGRVKGTSIIGDIDDSGVKKCTLRVLRRMRFSRNSGGGICLIRQHLVFSSTPLK